MRYVTTVPQIILWTSSTQVSRTYASPSGWTKNDPLYWHRRGGRSGTQTAHVVLNVVVVDCLHASDVEAKHCDGSTEEEEHIVGSKVIRRCKTLCQLQDIINLCGFELRQF